MTKLLLVGLPIGHPQDITQRAYQALEQAPYILAEDTRNLVKLLRHYGIATEQKKIDSFHDHSEGKLEGILAQIKNFGQVVLVSDAGSPIVSDPAYPLVKAALEHGVEVDSYSGVSSVIMALELSGLPPHPFHFYGFAPREESKRRQSFEKVSSISGQHIFFESPHRLEKTLQLLEQEHPLADVFLGRELTKKFQTSYRFLAKDLADQDIKFKGEFVMSVYFPQSEGPQDSKDSLELKALAETYLDSGGGTKSLAKVLAKASGRTKASVYQQLTQLKIKS